MTKKLTIEEIKEKLQNGIIEVYAKQIAEQYVELHNAVKSLLTDVKDIADKDTKQSVKNSAEVVYKQLMSYFNDYV